MRIKVLDTCKVLSMCIEVLGRYEGLGTWCAVHPKLGMLGVSLGLVLIHGQLTGSLFAAMDPNMCHTLHRP